MSAAWFAVVWLVLLLSILPTSVAALSTRPAFALARCPGPWMGFPDTAKLDLSLLVALDI